VSDMNGGRYWLIRRSGSRGVIHMAGCGHRTKALSQLGAVESDEVAGPKPFERLSNVRRRLSVYADAHGTSPTMQAVNTGMAFYSRVDAEKSRHARRSCRWHLNV
jgi:hypothetical protein